MTVISIVLAVACAYKMLLTLQQSGYKTISIFDYNKSHFKFAIITGCFAILAFALDLVYNTKAIYYGVSFMAVVVMLIDLFDIFSIQYKKPLVFTPRIKRIIAVFVAFCVLINLLYLTRLRCLTILIYALIPCILEISKLIMKPIEKMIATKYVKNAEMQLNRSDLIKIGITGSYGKTSVKNILKELLSNKYNTVATPLSYNTPMGISRAVNLVDNTTEVFIAEMGARNIGDIKELCDIVHPTYGIITGVNNQHLETFKSIVNIKHTKFELLQNLIGKKFAVVNGDNPYSHSMLDDIDYDCVSVGEENSNDLRISDIKINKFGTKFKLHLDKDKSIDLSTRLLGRHNALNISLAIGLAIKLGVDLDEIKQSVFNLKPVPHRLELIDGARGITIIDDTYNSNPDGANNALDVLSAFEGRKVIVTPGLVELGNATEVENKKLGKKIDEICDKIILINSDYSKFIKEGIKNKKKIICYDSLKDATLEFGSTLEAYDTMLMLNDLPDSL